MQHLSKKEWLRKIIGIYMTGLLLIVVASTALAIIDKTLVENLFDYSILAARNKHMQNFKRVMDGYDVLLIIIIGPLIEEVMFRLPLRLARSSFSVSAGLIFYMLTGGSFYRFHGGDWMNYAFIGSSVMIVILTYKFFPSRWIEVIKTKYFGLYFYGMALVFGLLHIGNFAPYDIRVLWLYPLFILPQFIMGLFIGYARLKYGFFAGWCIHALLNTPNVLFSHPH